jgi:heme-degrading monooxygenase HmoA
MIARHWRGLVASPDADAYIDHLQTETFPHLATLAGFISGSILKREIGQGTEFVIVTVWESLQAIARFAGQDPEAAVVPEKVRPWMIEYDRRARHYDVVTKG